MKILTDFCKTVETCMVMRQCCLAGNFVLYGLDMLISIILHNELDSPLFNSLKKEFSFPHFHELLDSKGMYTRVLMC